MVSLYQYSETNDILKGYLTDVMDDNLYTPEGKEKRKPYSYGTYVMMSDNYKPKLYPIRFPGATRGHIEVDDDMIIKDIKIYESSGIYSGKPHTVGIYDPDIKVHLKEFIGKKLVIDRERTYRGKGI